VPVCERTWRTGTMPVKQSIFSYDKMYTHYRRPGEKTFIEGVVLDNCAHKVLHSKNWANVSPSMNCHSSVKTCLHTSSARYCTADVFPVPVSPTSSRGSQLLMATAMRSSSAVAGRVNANWEVGWRSKLGRGESFRCKVDRPTDMTSAALHVGGVGWYCLQ